MHEYKGALDAEGKRFAVVVSRFNDAYTSRLLEGAVDGLARLGAGEEDVEVFWVPGSFELPGVALNAAHTGSFDAVICLGVLVRGATAHFDLVAQQTAAGIARVFPATGVPCIFGVVTAENLEQAAERCGSKMGNRGWEAAHAAVEMVNLGEAFDGWAAEETMVVEEPEASEDAEPAPEPSPAESR